VIPTDAEAASSLLAFAVIFGTVGLVALVAFLVGR
jgi:hypothetical protein